MEEKHSQILGKLIGKGSSRNVYEHLFDKELCIKVALNKKAIYSNKIEWNIYKNAPEHVRDWLVPAVFIHPSGEYIIFKKGQKVKKLPFIKPDYLKARDTNNPINWVTINGRYYICDYANYRFEKDYSK